MFSIVCVYNNKKVYDDHILKSLESQTASYELIAIDNSQKEFSSASDALNCGGGQAKGKYIMFVHQDVRIDSRSWLADAERMLDSLADVGIAGVAGSSECGIVSIIEHGVPPRSPADVSIYEPTKVQTLDECLAIIPGDVFETLKFDGNLCDNWHLYVVDFCLRCKMLGFEVYTLPMYVYHRSSGSSGKSLFEIIASMSLYSNQYYLTLEKLLYKYKGYYKYIYTTCGVWNTSYPLIFQRYLHFMRSGPKYVSEKITRWINEAIA
jgi:hypothetical protein